MGLSGDNKLIQSVNYFLDGMGKLIPKVAERAAKPIQDFTRSGHARGISPSGKQNAPRKKDGAVAYLRPTQAITFRGEGTTVVGEGDDVLKYPQTSSKYPREIFPIATTNIPPEYENAIKSAAENIIAENAPVDK